MYSGSRRGRFSPRRSRRNMARVETSLNVEKMHFYLTTHYLWQQAYAVASTPQERWTLLRTIYRYHMPEILAASARHLRGRIEPSFVEWDFTPIEEIAWQTIRSLGTPLYPQVPVDRFFLDFANPYYKIGLELDGAAFHDFDSDARRDNLLMQQGWRIFRIPGAETHARSALPQDWEDRPQAAGEPWMTCTCDGVI